ncbi:MarR family winged helix-turn-helix transcriptional regulator [Shinella kummerowiae]|jgi:DNA-binding MarR family transcriptional regulator|uniref:MarR family winged helix-turn-helix transcriptional regulator n=1 Tax=Shinella kummerowiae TaxID=417745 RepID=UPI0021B60A35|nr:MarR family transcriptional regulator [Shinella kummerowiae]MCT7663280.1 MarR family transcriptional regulator [Shinella kummerowiae]
MPEDIVRALGYLCLGTRLRRIGEQVQAETQRIMERMDAPLQAGQYPLLAAIDRVGPLSVGELAETLGITQPGVTRMAGLLAEAGYLTARKEKGDQRIRRLALTEEGQALIARSKQDIWPLIEAAVRNVCEPLGGSLIDQLDQLEDALAEAPLDRRARALEGQQP